MKSASALILAICCGHLAIAQDATDAFKHHFDSEVVEIDEHAPFGTVVLNRPSDHRLISDFRIESGNDLRCFDIDAKSGQIRVTRSAPLDFETQSELTLVVSASPREESISRFETEFEASLLDSGLSPGTLQRLLDRRFEATVTIRLRDLNESPDLNDDSFSIPESAANGVAVGSVTGSDTDVGDVLSYSIVSGNDNGAFEIDSATGALTIRRSDQLDYERVQQHNLAVQVSDSGGLTATADVVIMIQDVDEPPIVDPLNLTRPVDADPHAEVGTDLPLPVESPPVESPAVEAPPIFGAEQSSPAGTNNAVNNAALRPFGKSPTRSASRSEQFNESLSKVFYGLAILFGLVALVPVAVTVLWRKMLQEQKHTEAPLTPPEFVLSDTVILDLLIASESYASKHRGESGQSVERVGQAATTGTSTDISRRYSSAVEGSMNDSGGLRRLDSAEHHSHKGEHRHWPVQQTFEWPQDEVCDAAPAADLSEPSPDPEPPPIHHPVSNADAESATTALSEPQDDSDALQLDVADVEPFADVEQLADTDDAFDVDDVPAPAAYSDSSFDFDTEASCLTAEPIDDYSLPTDSPDVDERTIRDYVSKLLAREQRKSPEPASNQKSGQRRTSESPSRKQSADRRVPEPVVNAASSDEPSEVEGADEAEGRHDVGHEVRRFLREFMLREFLRNNMTYFREVSQRSLDAAIATATRRRLRKQIGPRIMLTAFFGMASLASVIASMLNVCEFGPIAQLLLLSAFCSMVELHLTIRRCRLTGRTISALHERGKPQPENDSVHRLEAI
ncbi:MAG: cadherin repeat domain-containing protein [Planctomycetaceae bacterium]